MDWLKSKWVYVVGCVLIAVGAVLLLLNGKAQSDIEKIAGLAIAAFGAVITLIKAIIDGAAAKSRRGTK